MPLTHFIHVLLMSITMLSGASEEMVDFPNEMNLQRIMVVEFERIFVVISIYIPEWGDCTVRVHLIREYTIITLARASIFHLVIPY